MSPKNLPYNPDAQKVLKAFADLLAPRRVKIENHEEEEPDEFGKFHSEFRTELPTFPTAEDIADRKSVV